MGPLLSPSASKVQEALKTLGFPNQVVELAVTTRTSAEAARAVGCRVEQIVKTIVFRGSLTGRPILVMASGSNRVDEKKVEPWVSEPLVKADATFVREKTGFVIGGVPPVGHLERAEMFIDEDLFQYDEIWAAAGTPRAVFKLSPEDLVKMTGGRVIPIK
ncbi:MAG: YbaK/EbsC family protein [Desulfobacterota bacterium]|nr:YbaK/EbsC family protein [Thermodesulfobacteriota bacterium]